MTTTTIEWAQQVWNPITGCTVHSPGCTNCYAMQLAGTRLQHIPSRAGLTKPSKAGPVWTGEVRFNEEWLTQPLRWKRPRMIFVCAHGDLFHEAVPDEWIDRIFAVMALCPQHTFQVLTKRSDRMRDYCSSRFGGWGETRLTDAIEALDGFKHDGGGEWGEPLPNVWLGVSVEDQTRADQRIPDLLATPAAVRWISAEPLLGPVDLQHIEYYPGFLLDGLTGKSQDGVCPDGPGLDWIVGGGESGKSARPMHPDWARSLRDQCAAADVPFFFKQWGEWAEVDEGPYNFLMGPDGERCTGSETVNGAAPMRKVGKKAAGRLLDGAEHNAMPGTPA